MHETSAAAPLAAKPTFVVSDFDFAKRDMERIAAALGPERWLLVKGHDALREALVAHPETDVICALRPPADTFELVPQLQWIALPSAGADHAFRSGLIKPGGVPIVTTANGVHTVPISEYVLSSMLLWTRHWPTFLALQHAATWPDSARWTSLSARELHGATLGLIGLGAIGRGIARLGRAFGMRVLATRRSATAGEHDPDADELLPQANLTALLAQADFVVIAVPNTPETHHLIGAEQLRAMKPTAFLINIARGSVVDEAALIEALRTGVIGGAGLDVFENEPLPSDSPLWSLPNVMLTPHISGLTNQYSRRFTDLFLENIAHYRAGEPLRNVVDPSRGY